ncbi:MAG: cyclopropane-fatty-acyl-phospholipid synthase family protein [Burkholderiales bacterium]|jgi:cyclopropane-fatty-acyl-phospholipid synthase|nr:cyclopropane-fatty-acyl-phospholipid synthase family protein [Burkholderiales bacterium]
MNQAASTTLSFELPHNAPAAARWVLKVLNSLKHGTLEVTTPDGAHLQFGHGGQPHANMHIKDWNLCNRVLKAGDIGLAESFIDDEWATTDLTQLLILFLLNRKEVESMIYGSFLGSLFYRLKHLLNRNTKAQAKKNIHAHYDLGNNFYKLWLDPSMTYSSAFFKGDENMGLEQAQHEKYQAILDWIQPKNGDKLLEIGCGWGGFAEAAGRLGAHVTGLTLSSQQLAYAKERLQNAGLATQADLRFQDYRDCGGSFDGIASIEMFEAVGEQYWPSYFKTVADRLKPGGRAGIQVITIDESLFDRYRKSTDFIQQYIFPGGMLPSKTLFRQLAEKAGLRVVKAEEFGLDYAKTLRIWRDVFTTHLAEVRAQGFDEKFIRIWTFYLAYCEAGFMEKNTDVVQFYLEKPKA